MSDLAIAHKEWVETNPLRTWRKDNQIAIHAAAAMLGVSMSTIQLWEAGSTTPGPKYEERLKRVIGPQVMVRWTSWIARNPVMQNAG